MRTIIILLVSLFSERKARIMMLKDINKNLNKLAEAIKKFDQIVIEKQNAALASGQQEDTDKLIEVMKWRLKLKKAYNTLLLSSIQIEFSL